MQNTQAASKPLLAVSLIVGALLLILNWPVWRILQEEPQFWLASWLPLLTLTVALARWPWGKPWSFRIDAIGTWLLVFALMALLSTFVYGERVLVALATALVGWAISRGLYSRNQRPLSGIWLPFLLPLLLTAGLDSQLTRWHDQWTAGYTKTMLDAIAVPNDGLTMLPAKDDSEVYPLSSSGAAPLSWGTWVGISLLVSAAFGRRLVPSLFLAATAYLFAVGASLLLNLGPAYTDRFLGAPWHVFPPPGGDAAAASLLVIAWLVVILVLVSADQFWRFVFHQVEPDPESAPMVMSVSRLWNRLVAQELSPRRMKIVNSQALDNPVAIALLAIVLAVAAVFVVRHIGQSAPPGMASLPTIVQSDWQDSEDKEIQIEWIDRKRFPGSRLGDRSWIWVTSIQNREVVFRLDFSASAQTDVPAELRLLGWDLEQPWTSGTPIRSLWKRKSPQRGLVLIQPLPVTNSGDAVKNLELPMVSVGHFPNLKQECLFDPRIEGAVPRSRWTVWAFTEHMGDLPPAFEAELITQFQGFVDSMSKKIN